MATRKTSKDNQIEDLRDDVREDVRELHQKIEAKVDGIRKESKADLDKQSDKLEKRAAVKFTEVNDKIDKVHECVHQARDSIQEMQTENAVAHEKVNGDLKTLSEKIDKVDEKADEARKVMLENVDETRKALLERIDGLTEAISEVKQSKSSENTQVKKTETPILDAIRKRAITVLGIVGTAALIAICLLLIELAREYGVDIPSPKF